jgi:tRNA threonylcarbamoyladenosine biosynthesis protein TsaE
LGEALGKQLKGGEIIELISDLGGGKTTLTRGISKGAGSIDHVSSPTFKICNIYNCSNNIKIYHYDFYRLNDAGLIQYELQDAFNDPKAVILIEWGDVLAESLPNKKIIVEISKTEEKGRNLKIEIPNKYNYIEITNS